MEPMIYRNVQGTRLPALGFGTFQLTGEVCRSQVEEALQAGYRHIDTARAYGNEEQVGEAIQASGVEREDIFLASKIWRDDLRPADLLREAERSLKALRSDYHDLLLIHWPNLEIPLEDSLAAMQKLKEEGKIRHIGVSNFPSSLFRKACQLAPVFTNQVEYHPLLGQTRVLEAARECSAVVTAYSPLGQGIVLHDEKLAKIGKRHGKNPAQVALRWLLQQDDVVAIPRTRSAEHLRSNFQVFDFELSEEEMREIDGLPKDQRQVVPSFAPNWDE